MPPHDGRGVRCRLRHPAPFGRRRGGGSVFGFGFFFVSSRPPAPATRWGAVGSGCAETQMRLDSSSGDGCYHTCVESHQKPRPTHEGEEVRCWARHPLAPTPGSERDFQLLVLFGNHGGHRRLCRGLRHGLRWGGNSDMTRLSVGEGMCLCLLLVASGVACHPTAVGG